MVMLSGVEVPAPGAMSMRSAVVSALPPEIHSSRPWVASVARKRRRLLRTEIRPGIEEAAPGMMSVTIVVSEPSAAPPVRQSSEPLAGS
jgi:hypothetical protein